MRPVREAARERGTALVIGLLLLLVLTVFAISGMSTATMELVMAGNSQFEARAFEAAESVLDAELRRPDLIPPPAPALLPDVAANIDRDFLDQGGNPIATATARTRYLESTDLAGWQLGGPTSFDAHHFEAAATATAGRGASASHLQGFFVIGPSVGP